MMAAQKKYKEARLQIPLRDKTQNLNSNGVRMGFIPGSQLLAKCQFVPATVQFRAQGAQFLVTIGLICKSLGHKGNSLLSW
jgi:hypothetical protein